MAAMNAHNDATPFYELGPETIIQAVESAGFRCDGRQLALNSYENRVYQVGLEDAAPVVAKFYRPGRWTDAQILEEHGFSLELAAAELPVVPPLVTAGHSLLHFEGFRFALFERRGGHAPELDQRDTRIWLGRFMARIHNVGSASRFRVRPALSPARYGHESVATILGGGWLPPHLESAFRSLSQDLLAAVDSAWSDAGNFGTLRLHGDCHAGNILWREGPFFVDLDDSLSGPAVQDLWMFLAGEGVEMAGQMRDLLEGYEEFRNFDRRELQLVEALRTLRMLHHAAWLARRWEDPAFPIAFPWFGEARYWENLVLGLREQLGRVQEPGMELPY